MKSYRNAVFWADNQNGRSDSRAVLVAKDKPESRRCTSCERAVFFLFGGPPDLHGYSRIGYRDPSSGQVKTVTAHRASWITHFGLNSVGPQLEVSHRCHNKTCVRIDHLSLEPAKPSQSRQEALCGVSSLFWTWALPTMSPGPQILNR
ncbi:hypothetical protein BaRGS_00008681 [Batillaria attramentaria]|uniref:Zinc-binding loop region of homing endonuclease domain-containing protein n=1 Tax=Batillaria attramentaria TaxID=370345 RepID=A0ABD0LKS5_9CAEN